jgi:hypothetical protein
VALWLVRALLSPLCLLRSLTAEVSTMGAGRRVGRCPGCGTTVFETDPHVRYRGDVFHAEPCVEISPYATGRR